MMNDPTQPPDKPKPPQTVRVLEGTIPGVPGWVFPLVLVCAFAAVGCVVALSCIAGKLQRPALSEVQGLVIIDLLRSVQKHQKEHKCQTTPQLAEIDYSAQLTSIAESLKVIAAREHSLVVPPNNLIVPPKKTGKPCK